MEFANLTPKNALLYASRCYDNPQCFNLQEFLEDYRRFKYVKRLCHRYLAKQPVSIRLFLNHVIALVNVFGAEATVRLLFMKCDTERSYRILKPFLEYLSVLPETIVGINGYDIVTVSIPSDTKIAKQLQEL